MLRSQFARRTTSTLQTRLSPTNQISGQTALLEGGWRLVKIKNPDGTAEAIPSVRVADTATDIGLAGLSLRRGLGSLKLF